MHEIPIKLLVSPNKVLIDENTIIVVQYPRHEDGGYKVFHCIKLWHSHEYFILSQTMKLNYSRKMYRSNKIAQTYSNLFLGFAPISISRFYYGFIPNSNLATKISPYNLTMIGGPVLWPLLLPSLWVGFFPLYQTYGIFPLFPLTNFQSKPYASRFSYLKWLLVLYRSVMVFHFTISDLALLY